MARPDEDRDPAREEEAALVDDLVRQLRRAGPVAGSGPAKSGAAHFDRPDVGSKPLTYSAPAAMGKVGIWTLVGLGALLGTALTQWPYGRACGWPLGFYLIAVATLVVTGMWGALASWRGRLGLAHIVALGTILWGLTVSSQEVLPRVGYAKNPAVWSCAEGRATTPGSPPPAKRGP